ncbi:uncharacterized protein H6S33_005635 [Morchella sextelata]|uniref:uncharacterized protein n=1 Tax=Morchella sextelata TaxID=1174677 RepID=UPI001D05778E|nr:uncharacterized protein H6S33_005635 [Morchella sextelata]KAH0613749.1 hypothetical protein H6S33_005635 [Morchella sextelata]
MSFMGFAVVTHGLPCIGLTYHLQCPLRLSTLDYQYRLHKLMIHHTSNLQVTYMYRICVPRHVESLWPCQSGRIQARLMTRAQL